MRLKNDAYNVFMAFFSDALWKKLSTAPCTESFIVDRLYKTFPLA